MFDLLKVEIKQENKQVFVFLEKTQDIFYVRASKNLFTEIVREYNYIQSDMWLHFRPAAPLKGPCSWMQDLIPNKGKSKSGP